jgi:alginate O-acetyltransferase complex protein AlgI
MIGSVIAIYWLQPALPIRYSDFILPTTALVLTVAMWWFTRDSSKFKVTSPEPESRELMSRDDGITLGVIIALVIVLSFMRFVDADYRLMASRPPEPVAIFGGLIAAAAVTTGISLGTRSIQQRHLLSLLILFMLVLFVVLKSEPLAIATSRVWRGLTGQDTSLGSMADLNWLGFSYVAFRLIHTLRDRQTELLPVLSLREYVTYVIFFPAFTAGPIDRAERFDTDWRTLPEKAGLDAARFTEGVTRIMSGLLKKFIIADSLAQGLSLTAVNVTQTTSTAGLWLLLYGYALRLFFDFSGYSDIAIGIGILFGIKLPENFNRPYLKTSITTFWQCWHITLSNWARFYVFSPLSRWLLMQKRKPSPAVIVLSTQVATMLVIGLWHGIALNFVIWGLWHGVGLFIHKQWSDRTRHWYRRLNDQPSHKRLWVAFSWFVTFHYVVIGWLWFALPDTGQAVQVLAGLFGLRW